MNANSTLLFVVVSLSLTCRCFSQIDRSERSDETYLKASELSVSEGLGIKSMEIDFTAPNPGSSQGVAEGFPLKRTRLADELLRVDGKLTVHFEVFSKQENYQINVKLPLEVVVLKDVDVSKYKELLERHKERKKHLLLSEIKNQKKKDRFQTFELEDDKLLQEFVTDELIDEIERRDLNFRNEVIWKTEIEISKNLIPNSENEGTVEIPISEIIYPQNLKDNRIYKLQVAQTFPHVRKRVGMFYTIIVLNDR